MKKLVGLLVFLGVLYAVLLYSNPGARSAANHLNLARRIGELGILCLGAGLLIITGGIDLAVGSVVGLSATLMAVLLVEYGMAPWAAVAVVLLLGAAIGLAHGLLVTKLKLQAFVVTLCGMFIYRGAARWLTGDGVRGLGNQATYLADAGFDPTDIAGQVAATQSLQGFLWTDDVVGLPRVLVVFLVLAALAALFLHGTVFGRYFFALGSNERAARFSGIATDRYKILAYVLSALTAAFAGIINLMQINSAQPSTTGQSFELYAIAGAVLGGCSLRGGEGNILGILIGTAILRLLPNLTNMWGIPSLFEPVVVGVALLAGALVDEVLRPRGAAAK